jgi:putative heme degradation protein
MSFDSSARFSASSSEDLSDCESATCRCCASRQRALDLTLWDAGAEWASPLTPGVLPDNIAIGEIGNSVRIDLWRDWPRMLAGLRRLGPVLAMTRNACAALGTWRDFPDLEWSELRAADEEGEFDFDLRHWARAYARHQRGVDGHLFSAEFHDHEGVCFHRVCLVQDSSLDAFTEWARVHQSIAALDVPPPPEEDIAREPIGGGAWRDVGAEAISHFLRECLSREMPVRAIVGSSGAVQGHRFVPRKLSTVDGWTYCHSEEVALHYQPEALGEVRLHDLAPGGSECWTLRAYDPSGRLALMLLPATSERLLMWNFLLRALA